MFGNPIWLALLAFATLLSLPRNALQTHSQCASLIKHSTKWFALSYPPVPPSNIGLHVYVYIYPPDLASLHHSLDPSPPPLTSHVLHFIWSSTKRESSLGDPNQLSIKATCLIHPRFLTWLIGLTPPGQSRSRGNFLWQFSTCSWRDFRSLYNYTDAPQWTVLVCGG